MATSSREQIDPVVAIDRLSFRYPGNEFALSIPKLRIEQGRRVAIVGPSGSGKTTLLHLLAGILKPSSGRVEVAGTVMSNTSDAERRLVRLRRVGLVFQEFELLEHLTVRENILLPLMLAPSRATVDEAHLDRLTEHTGISRYLSRRPRHLSQGERQRVAICRALITGPSLLLADEPTGNLDPAKTSEILDTMLSEVQRHEASLVMVTHDHSLLDRFDEVIDFANVRATGPQADPEVAP